MTQFLDTAVDKSLSVTGAWTDIDLSANVPTTATGAIFQVTDVHVSAAYRFGLRKKGSTDDRYMGISGYTQMFCVIGIDVNRKCEGKVESLDVDFILVGYTEGDVTFFTNAYDKSQSTTGTWTDLDLSSELPEGSVAAIFQIENVAAYPNPYTWSLRKKGSTDDRYADLDGQFLLYFIVGVDTNRKCQFKIESTNVDFYLLGYLSAGEAETNGVDRSLGSTGSYIDITESNAPNGATGAFIDLATTDLTYFYAARKNGDSGDIYGKVPTKKGAIFVGLDTNKKWEGKISNTGVDFYTLGYFRADIQEKNSSDTGSGVDAALGIQVAVITTDGGTGIDTILESLSTRLESEVGSGVDALISLLKVIAKYGSDTGVGAEAISEQLSALIQAETGIGADAETLQKIINVLSSADSGMGTEAIASLLSAIEQYDVGSGIEAVGSRLFGSSDTGTGVDALQCVSDILPIEQPYTAKLGGVSLWIPKLSTQNFTLTYEENDLPRFSFTIQNCDVNRTAITDHLTDDFVIYRGATPIFTGVIDCDQIEYVSIDQIKVGGFSKWIELGYLLFKRMADADAESADAVYIRDHPSSWEDRTTAAGNDTINDVTVTFNGAGDGIYMGDTDRFNSIKVKYSTKGIQTGTPTFNVQYSKGSDVWATLDCIDESREFTKDPGTYFIFMPTLPSDWSKQDGKYWIRIVIATGSYSTMPKLDRIWISQTDVCRVQFDNTAADTIMDLVLADTEYSVDETDQCPSTIIPSIRGDYDSKLRWVAGIVNALKWEEGNGDDQPYAWWIDDSKKIHVKQVRGSSYGDITVNLTVLGNRLNYFDIANRIFGLGGGTGTNQYHAIVENRSAQDTLGEIRETTYNDSRIFDHTLLKGQSGKLLTQSKTAKAQVKCSMPTYNWFEGGYEIGDRIKLHQPKWGIPDETEYAIRRVDISLDTVTFDVGIGREHLDNLQGNIQQQMNIQDVYMQGETSTFQVGPVEENYQRVDATTVYPVKMRIEIPSNATAINKALISWKLGPYQADVIGTYPGGGHGHAPATPNTGLAGGHAHSGDTDLGGGFTPTELGNGEHTHTMDVLMTYDTYLGYIINSLYSSYENEHKHATYTPSAGSHGHPAPSCGSSSGQVHACTTIGYGTSCTSGACVDVSSTYFAWVATSGHSHTIGSISSAGSHTHPDSLSGSGASHHHALGTGQTPGFPKFFAYDPITASAYNVSTDEDHIHTINDRADFTLGIQTLADFTHTVPGTDTKPDFSLDLAYGKYEEPGDTIMELIINGVTVGSAYDGDSTDLKVRGFLQTGSNDVVLQPASGQNHKGSAQLDATIKVFIDTE